MSKTFLKKIKKKHFIFLLGLVIVIGCSQNSLNPIPAKEEKIKYTLIAESINIDSIRFELNFNNASAYNGEFILPYHFFDNPAQVIKDSIIKNLNVVDSLGKKVNYDIRTIRMGPIENKVISLESPYLEPVTISYGINSQAFLPDSVIRMNAFLISDSSLFFLGASVFIVPLFSENLVNFWRIPHNIEFEIKTKAGIPVFGIDQNHRTTLRNTYELLFNQISVGKRAVIQGYCGEMRFSIINYLNKPISPYASQYIVDSLGILLKAVSDVYGSFRSDQFTIHLLDIGGALEGTFGFSAADPEVYVKNQRNEIVLHEAIHNYIGIRCGDYEDPWWKEGGTTYLALQLGVRNKYIDKDYFHGKITKKSIYADSSRFQIKLSDPRLRSHMFVDKTFPLVYDKGAQIMLLLDCKIRAASGNKSSIESVSSNLVKRYDGSAFRRNDLLNAIRMNGDAHVDAIFKLFVDSTAFPSSALLESNFRILDSLGAF
jgi:predicted metalloprotease with PDZ domain